MIYLVDWLSFTTKNYTYEQMIGLLKLPLLDWKKIQGFYGYEVSIYYDGIRIHYTEGKEGCFVNFSGQGCRNFETYSALSWFDIFSLLLDENEDFNVTRVDIACDEKEGILPLKKIADISNKFILGDRTSICTRFTWANVNNSTQGLSVYFGSPKSEFRIRIYDKAAETGTEGHWIRTELQIRRQHATNMLRSILNLNDVGRSFCGVVNNYIRFIQKSHTRSENCLNLQWWDRFINTAEKIRIFKSVGVEYNLKHITNYLDKQAGNSLQTYVRSHGGDLSDLINLIMRPRRLSKKQMDLIKYHDGS